MQLPVTIRQESDNDIASISDLVKRAYADVPYSDHTEQIMIARLRASTAFVPALSLVAESGSCLVGHVLVTKVWIRDGERATPSLALAPLSVVPEAQGQGVGTALVTEAHRRVKALGYRSLVVIGPSTYYRRFGYLPLDAFEISVPFTVRPENCMILPLVPKGLEGVRGMVDYPVEWTDR
jgi:predicted N-acetyltransferase YhbS